MLKNVVLILVLVVLTNVYHVTLQHMSVLRLLLITTSKTCARNLALLAGSCVSTSTTFVLEIVALIDAIYSKICLNAMLQIILIMELLQASVSSHC